MVMRWYGLNLLVLGYGIAAVFATLLAMLGVGLIACLILFWLGGAILTISVGAIRLAFPPQENRPNGLGVTNVIRLETSMLQPTLKDRTRT